MTFSAEGLSLKKNQRPSRPRKCKGCGRYSYADAACADAVCLKDLPRVRLKPGPPKKVAVIDCRLPEKKCRRIAEGCVEIRPLLTAQGVRHIDALVVEKRVNKK